jgi:hypothetical protein
VPPPLTAVTLAVLEPEARVALPLKVLEGLTLAMAEQVLFKVIVSVALVLLA